MLAFDAQLIPPCTELKDAIWAKAREWVDVVKIGRTHLQDATPLTVGQEWSGYAAQLEDALLLIRESMQGLYRLAIGGTAVGTGLNAPEGFGPRVAAKLAETAAPAVCLGAEQIRGAGLAGCDGRRERRAARAGRGADQDRQRPALAGLGPARRDFASFICRRTSRGAPSCPAR